MPMHMQCPNVVVGVDAVALVVALWCGVGLGSGWSDRKAADHGCRKVPPVLECMMCDAMIT